MKKRLMLFIFTAFLLLLNGCSQDVMKTKNVQTHTFYAGDGDKWFATYTISKVKTSFFCSLYIQYVFDRSVSSNTQLEKIGPIEYVLDAKIMKLESSFPQELQGIGNFNTATEMNADKSELPNEVSLEIKWRGKSETIMLKKL